MQKVFGYTLMVLTCFVAPSMAQVLIEENFDDAAASAPLVDVIHPDTGEPLDEGVLKTIIPEGWEITAELRPEDDGFNFDWPYPGWVALWNFEWDTQDGNREMEVPGFLDGLMIADSDLFGARGARSWLKSPIVDVDASAVIIEFDSHYRHNDNQMVTLDITWDNGETYEPVLTWSDDTHEDNQDYIEHVIQAVEKPADATTVGIQFRFFGDSDQDGYHDFDWYWAIDNVVVKGGDISKPVQPNITVEVNEPGNLSSNIVLRGSTFNSPSGAEHNKSVWEVSLNENFDPLVFRSDTTTELTEIEVPYYRVPMGETIYARVSYDDTDGASSNFSEPAEFQITTPGNLKTIFFEDFESTDEGELPSNFKQVNFNDPLTGTPEDDLVATWTVITQETLASYGGDRVNVPVFDGKSAYVDSDAFEPYQEAHLLTEPIDLSGVSDVWLIFESNYVQNQDNIGVLEYSVDGGDLSDDRTISGTWLPIAYLLEDVDISFNEDGTPNAADTFTEENFADGTAFPYSYYIFASPVDELDAFISPRVNDDKSESKRYERYRLDAADDQQEVVIRWMNMGTDSWFWGLDNVTILGDDGTAVSNWSLY